MTDMITIPRSELQEALDALIWTTGSDDFGETGKAREGAVKVLFPAIEALRARLAQPEQTSVAEQYAHRLAILLECMILSPDKTWNEANNLVSEYHDALHKEHMNAGEPYVSGFGKD